MKILVWGIGHMAENLCFPKNVEVEAVDCDTQKQGGKLFQGKRILAPDMVRKEEFDYILVTSGLYETQIIKQIQEMGFEKTHTWEHRNAILMMSGLGLGVSRFLYSQTRLS